jgi:lipopolysaccharide export LptBFGC system permease protein LptF
VGFHLLNRVVGYAGSIYEWPVAVSALLPSAIFLMLALCLLWMIERR